MKIGIGKKASLICDGYEYAF